MKNIEIKARIDGLDAARDTAVRLGARARGELRQADTFFPAPRGRLKLRCEGQDGSERAELIAYRRTDTAGPKASDYHLVPVPQPEALRQVLAQALGPGLEVRKRRELWLLGSTRIHLDTVEGLGCFLELEVAVGPDGNEADAETLARRFLGEFGVRPHDLVAGAYVDLLAAAGGASPA